MTPLAWDLLLVAGLVLATGLLSMAEMALVSSRKARLEEARARGKRGAETALGLARRPAAFLGTVRVLTTLVAVGAGALAGARLIPRLMARAGELGGGPGLTELAAWGVVILALTYLLVALGDLAPKRAALAAPERVAQSLARPVRGLTWVLAPVVRLVAVSSEALVRGLGIKPGVGSPFTEEEFKILLQRGTRAGVFDAREQNLLEGVLKLGDRRIDLLMTPRREIVFLDPSDRAEEVRRKLADSTHNLIPVCEGGLDNTLGVVRIKDLTIHLLGKRPLDLRAVMRNPLFIPEHTPALKVLESFHESGDSGALVIDEHGSIQGLVTARDILDSIALDPGARPGIDGPAVVQRNDGSWLVDGMYPIDELKEMFELGELFEEGRYNTLAGYVVTRLGHIPTAGETLDLGDLRLEVVDMDRYRVDKLLISRREEEGGRHGA